MKYENLEKHVEIICNNCNNIFNQRPSAHLAGCGCPPCSRTLSNTNEFIEKAKKLHGDKYDYSFSKLYNS